MRRGFPLFVWIIVIVGFVACGRKGDTVGHVLEELDKWAHPEYTLDNDLVLTEIHRQATDAPVGMYADVYTKDYYTRPGNPLIWVTRMGIDDRADTLMVRLATAESLGLSREAFSLDTLNALLGRARSLDFTSTPASRVLGQLEFLLTRAYLRYACGQRYGYIHPRKVFDNLLIDPPAPGETRKEVVYRRLFDQEADEVTDSFIHRATEKARQHRFADFLQEIQPTGPLYRQMEEAYQMALQQGDTARARLARINMERARWRYPHPGKGKYIFVNLAGQELTAVDTERDTMATMRVCCGNATHKTPLLHSAIRYVELNPYWVIPQTIVRKEIVPSHVGDSAYFARNNYHAIHKETKEEVNPATLTEADLRSARYTLRQEKGDGNSLGRIIFRFPNNFSVYLHDTNNRGAFQRANRAISHGCVRVERPLDLALFFLDNPTPWYIDRIRISIDLPPETAQGRQYKDANPEGKPLSSFGLPEPVPVWLDYWTLYPSPSGTLEAHADSYGYDTVIENKLNGL